MGQECPPDTYAGTLPAAGGRATLSPRGLQDAPAGGPLPKKASAARVQDAPEAAVQAPRGQPPAGGRLLSQASAARVQDAPEAAVQAQRWHKPKFWPSYMIPFSERTPTPPSGREPTPVPPPPADPRYGGAESGGGEKEYTAASFLPLQQFPGACAPKPIAECWRVHWHCFVCMLIRVRTYQACLMFPVQASVHWPWVRHLTAFRHRNSSKCRRLVGRRPAARAGALIRKVLAVYECSRPHLSCSSRALTLVRDSCVWTKSKGCTTPTQNGRPALAQEQSVRRCALPTAYTRKRFAPVGDAGVRCCAHAPRSYERRPGLARERSVRCRARAARSHKRRPGLARERSVRCCARAAVCQKRRPAQVQAQCVWRRAQAHGCECRDCTGGFLGCLRACSPSG